MSTEATASVKLCVKVQCEKCRRVYEYEKEVVARASSWSDTRSADDLAAECGKDLRERLNACLKGKSVKDLCFEKCPQCSHVQSWMLQSQAEFRDMTFFVVSVALALGTIIFVHMLDIIHKNVLYWLSIPFTIICGILYYHSMKSIFTLIRGSPESKPGQTSSSGPLGVKMIGVPKLIVKRERTEVY